MVSNEQFSKAKNALYHIAIFASGAGSNAKKIIGYFEKHPSIRIALVVCNNPSAGVIRVAADNSIPTLFIEKQRFFYGDAYAGEFARLNISFIVLAGFLWKIPSSLITSFPNRIVNIHPALLPKYGGKSMYGAKVHEAVIAAGDKESGITIHFVDEKYDNGAIIFQAKCSVPGNDTATALAERIHVLEHANYPRIIENCISNLQHSGT